MMKKNSNIGLGKNLWWVVLLVVGAILLDLGVRIHSTSCIIIRILIVIVLLVGIVFNFIRK